MSKLYAVEEPSPSPDFRMFRLGECTVALSKDDGAWHLSIAHETRFPTLEEIHQARYQLVPNKANMALLFPPREAQPGIAANCVHLWEVIADPNEAGVRMKKYL